MLKLLVTLSCCVQIALAWLSKPKAEEPVPPARTGLLSTVLPRKSPRFQPQHLMPSMLPNSSRAGAQWVLAGAVASWLAVYARQFINIFMNRARRAVESTFWTQVEVTEGEDPKLYQAAVRWLHSRSMLKSGSYKAMSSVDQSQTRSLPHLSPFSMHRQKPKTPERLGFRSADDVNFVPITVSGDSAQFTYRGRRFWARLDGGSGQDGMDHWRAVVVSMRPGAGRRAAKAANRRPPTLVISTLLRDGLNDIRDWMREALAEAELEDRKYVEVFELSSQSSPLRPQWELSCLARKRSIESVVLQSGLTEALVADVKAFIEDEDWYRERSLPHRRGYLLYGPPGSGKSSLILAIASHFGLPLCSISLDRLGRTPLSEALGSAPPCSVLCLEDVDVAYARNGPLNRAKSQMVKTTETQSLHELLNAIDGVASQDGRLLFLTTNDKDILDPALLRPGRCDRTFYLGDADKDMASRLFLSFFRPPPTPPDDEDGQLEGQPPTVNLQEMAAQFGETAANYSMASLQGVLLSYKDDPAAAIQAASELPPRELPSSESASSDPPPRESDPET